MDGDTEWDEEDEGEVEDEEDGDAEAEWDEEDEGELDDEVEGDGDGGGEEGIISHAPMEHIVEGRVFPVASVE